MAFDPKQDKEIINLIIKNEGDKAIKLLYKTRAEELKYIVKYVTSNGGSNEEGLEILDDSVVEFWLNAINNKFIYLENATLSTYINSIGINKWKSELNRKSRLESLDDKNINEDQDQNTDDVNKLVEEILNNPTMEDDRLWTIARCFKKLSMEDQMIFLARYSEELAFDKIAVKFGYVDINCSKEKLMKGVKASKQKIYRIIKDSLIPCINKFPSN